MNVSVVYGRLKKKLVLGSRATAFDALKKAGINPEIVLIKREGEIIPDAELLNDGDKLELLRVVTGG